MKLKLGSHVEMAKVILAKFEPLIWNTNYGFASTFDDGTWGQTDWVEIVKAIHDLDGTEIDGGGRIRLKNSDVNGVLRCLEREVSVDMFTWRKKVGKQ